MDLRSIKRHETKTRGRVKISGQMNFDSGFEWAYWVNSVITARASYEPLVNAEQDDHRALVQLIEESITNRIFPHDPTSSARMANILVKAMDEHHKYMVASARSDKDKHIFGNRTAISFITGYDMYADVGAMNAASNVAVGRVQMERMGDPQVRDFYRTQVRPNLQGLSSSLQQTLAGLSALQDASSGQNLEEIIDSFNITLLRTDQVIALYDHLALCPIRSSKVKLEVHRESDDLLKRAEAFVDAARELVDRRSKRYAVPYEAVAAWKPGPTVYKYRYLWTAQSLYYWYRDELIAKTLAKTRFLRPISPCLRNIENPLEEFFQFRGIALISKLTEHLVAAARNVPIIHEISDCINVPDHAPNTYSHDDPMPL